MLCGIGKLVQSIAGEVGNAITRLDALNNFPRVMSNLGISNEEAQQSIKLLSEKLKGLPTALDDATQAVQRFTSANGSVKASTVMFLGLNDAILAGGASSEIQKSALEQLSQAYAKGKPDMMEWRTAMMAMPAQLKQVASAMGFVSADQLGEALRNGTVSMNEFMATIARLDKEGVNGFQSFHEQALNSTGGVATAMTNLKITITRGLADIMNEIGQSNIAGFFQGVAKAIGTVTNYVVACVRVLVTAIKTITGLFGKKTSGAISNTTDSANQASTSMSNLGSSGGSASKGMDKATGSAKKLKKELNGLASFDEMNVLKEASDTGGSGGGSGGVGGAGGVGGLGDIDLSMFDELENGVSDADKIYEKIMGIANIIGSIAGEGFKLSFGDTNFDGILNHLKGIKDNLISIATDPRITNAIQNWCETALFNLGRVVGAVSRYATNIAEGFIGAIDKFISQNKERLTNSISNIFNINARNINIIGTLYQALGEITDVFKSDAFKQIGADIIAIFANPILSVIELLEKFRGDFLNIFVLPIVDNVEKIKAVFENVFGSIQIVTGTLAEAFTYIGDVFNEVYDSHIKPFFDDFAVGISDTFGKFLDVYQQYFEPAINRIAKKFNELWNTHLKPYVDSIGGLLGSVADALKALWDGILKPLIDWLIQNALPIIARDFEIAWNVVIAVLGIVGDTLSGVMQWLQGMIDFIVGVFTGDWDKAWKGIENIYKGVWKQITAIFKGAWDIIKGIFEPVANWFNTTVIEPTKEKFSPLFEFFNTLFTRIWDKVSTVFKVISELAEGCVNALKIVWQPIANWLNNTVINPIKTAFTNAWNTLKTGATNAWNGIKSVFSTVASFFGDIFSKAWNKVKAVFSTGGAVFSGIKEGIVEQFKRVVNTIISGINKVISVPFNAINRTLDRIRNINIAGMTPFSGVVTRFNVPQIPQLARGGIVERGTLAVVGEHGKEAIMPLENNTGWLDKIGDRIANNINNEQPVQLVIKLGEDTIFDKFIENIKEKNFETNGEAFSI